MNFPVLNGASLSKNDPYVVEDINKHRLGIAALVQLSTQSFLNEETKPAILPYGCVRELINVKTKNKKVAQYLPIFCLIKTSQTWRQQKIKKEKGYQMSC